MRRTSAAFTLTTGLRPSLHPVRTRACSIALTATQNRRLHAARSFTRHTPRCASPPLTENVPEVRIRQASSTDIGTASRVLASAFTEDFLRQEGTSESVITLLLPLFELITRLEISGQLRKRIRNTRHAVLIAEIGEVIIGCAEVGILDIKRLTEGGDEVSEWGKGGGEAYVGNVGVLKGYRENGVGRRLLNEVEVVGESWGLNNVWLCVEARNIGAIRFYEKVGFRCVAQEPSWFDEIGKRRRLFLCSRKGLPAGEWGNAKVVGGKLGIFEYLRYCFYDLRRTREQNEKDGSR